MTPHEGAWSSVTWSLDRKTVLIDATSHENDVVNTSGNGTPHWTISLFNLTSGTYGVKAAVKAACETSCTDRWHVDMNTAFKVP